MQYDRLSGSERSDAGDSTLTGGLGLRQGLFLLAHGFSFQCDLVGVVNESVKNGVGECGITDGLVPVL